MKITDKALSILSDVHIELTEAIVKFDTFNSFHEGYAILKEEVDELWEEIKNKKQSKNKIRIEAIQVAAMAIRLIYDLIKE